MTDDTGFSTHLPPSNTIELGGMPALDLVLAILARNGNDNDPVSPFQSYIDD